MRCQTSPQWPRSNYPTHSSPKQTQCQSLRRPQLRTLPLHTQPPTHTTRPITPSSFCSQSLSRRIAASHIGTNFGVASTCRGWAVTVLVGGVPGLSNSLESPSCECPILLSWRNSCRLDVRGEDRPAPTSRHETSTADQKLVRSRWECDACWRRMTLLRLTSSCVRPAREYAGASSNGSRAPRAFAFDKASTVSTEVARKSRAAATCCACTRRRAALWLHRREADPGAHAKAPEQSAPDGSVKREFEYVGHGTCWLLGSFAKGSRGKSNAVREAIRTARRCGTRR